MQSFKTKAIECGILHPYMLAIFVRRSDGGNGVKQRMLANNIIRFRQYFPNMYGRGYYWSMIIVSTQKGTQCRVS